jgi:hypothetical protein
MSQEEKKEPDHLHADQDEVGGTDRPRYAEQQENTGEPGADVPQPDQGEGEEKDD